MAATLSNPQVSLAITATLTTVAAPATTTTNVSHSATSQLTVGSSSGNVNKCYSATTTVASSGSPSTLDLTSLTDPQGNALTFATVNSILIENTDTTAGHDVTPGGGTNPVFASFTNPLYGGTTPGKALIDYGSTGVTITGASNNNLKLTIAAGTNMGVKVTILGK